MEAENANGEMFGKQRLMDTLLAKSKEEPEIIIRCIIEEIDLYLVSDLSYDDIIFGIEN